MLPDVHLPERLALEPAPWEEVEAALGGLAACRRLGGDAAQLRQLLRIKVSDAADVLTATRCVADGVRFFQELQARAQAAGRSMVDQLQPLRAP